jgi:hypothetical protein
MEIRKLLEKYYEGSTTLKEEKLLADFFSRERLPDEFLAESALFQAFSASRSEEVLDETFDSEMLGLLQHNGSRNDERKSVLYYLSAIAAGFVFLVGSYFFLTRDGGPIEREFNSETFVVQDPAAAYEETRKALYLVSTVLNKGTRELSSISKFSDGTDQLQELGKFHEVEQLIRLKQ